MRTDVVGRAWIRGSEGERAEQKEITAIIIYVHMYIIIYYLFFF